MTTTALRTRLASLRAERAAAIEAGVAAIPLYMTDLEAEIEAVRAALVGTAVTEIAAFRAQLSGPQVG